MAFSYGKGGMYGPMFSDSFGFHPWMMDKDYNGITTRNMALLGYEIDVEKMVAQNKAGIPIVRMTEQMIDKTLLNALMKRWGRRYSGKSPSWKDRALFRSLNMANAAAALPGYAEVTNYDIGRQAALWVSAFEILAHPKTSDSGFRQVYELLEKAKWSLHHHHAPIYPSFDGRNRPRINRILPCWIYGELNHARNDFLHGNPVRSSRLNTKRSKRALFFYAWPLYRMALTAFLDLRFKQKPPSLRDPQRFARHLSDEMDFQSYQRDVEAGLSSVKFTENEWADVRNGRLSPTVVRRP